MFLSSGVWTYGDPEVSSVVGFGNVVVAEPDAPHGWQPIGEEPGLMVVVKHPAAA